MSGARLATRSSPAERAAVGDGRLHEGGGGLERRFVDAEVGPPGGFGLPPPRRGEAEDPPDVLGSREVDRAALGPRAHDRSGLDLRAHLGEVPGLRARATETSAPPSAWACTHASRRTASAGVRASDPTRPEEIMRAAEIWAESMDSA